MKLFTQAQRKQLIANHTANAKTIAVDGSTTDFKPVVKLFSGSATWLLTELDPKYNTAFGLCDLGMGFPELGEVSIDELESVGSVERDRWFEADYPLSHYTDDARKNNRINA